MSALVSVVIPTYNRPEMLARAIGSALGQSCLDLEVVVVDDGGAAMTPDVVGEFTDGRLRYVRNERRLGVLGNHAAGLQVATGRYVVFLADDDVLRPTFVADRLRVFAEFADVPDVTVVFSGFDYCDEAANVTGRFEPRLDARRPLGGTQLVQAALTSALNINGAMYRRDAVLSVWPWLAECGNAFDTALNLFLAVRYGAKGVYVPWCDLLYTRHDGQTSAGDAHFAHTTRMYAVVLRAPMGRRPRALIRKNLAAHYVVQGRALAARDDLASARRHFLDAIRTYPALTWAWTQAAQAVLAPRRLAARARPHAVPAPPCT